MLTKLVLALFLILGSSDLEASATPLVSKNNVWVDDFKSYAEEMYEELHDKDLNYQAFEVALKGYLKLQNEGLIKTDRFLTIIDMSLSANSKRFFLIDLDSRKIVHKSMVAHGRNSGGEFAKYFSNKMGSFKSSLGFYRTAETYSGKHGLSLRLDGLEYCNSNARKRAIVIHAADYVSEDFVQNNGRLGRSLGCPSLPQKDYRQIIGKIKNGSLLFIYYPEAQYFKNSPLANYSSESLDTDSDILGE